MTQTHEISPNLIDQLQISLHKQAGIESLTSRNLNSTNYYDDVNNSSYLNDAIVGRNFSADVSRCRNCNGELLRGTESIICVYCGVSQNRDLLRRHPISFKSTVAFQWFLQSLGLDGFENVGDQNEGTQSGDRGRRSVKEEEVSLSDLLDVKLKWADDDDDDDDSRGIGVRKDEEVSGKKYLSLVGVDVEEILAQDRRNRDGSSVGAEQAVVSEKVENERSGVSGEGSLSLFENMQSSEVASRSGEGGNDESFSDWGADFQSAFPGSGEVKSVNFSVSDAPRSFLTTFNSKVSEGNSLVEGVGEGVESNAFFEGLPTDQQLTNEASHNDEKIDGVVSFDELGDFSVPTSDKVTRLEPSNTAVPGTDISGGMVMADTFEDFIGSTVLKDTHLQSNSLKLPDDAGNTFITPHTGGEIPFRAIIGESKQHVGISNTLFSAESQPTLFNGYELPVGGTKSVAPGTTIELDDSFDNFLKGFDNQQQVTNKEVGENRISADSWNDFSVLGVRGKEEQGKSLEVVGGKGNDNQSGSLALDSWCDFTRSGVVSNSKATSSDISSGAWNDFSSLLVTEANQPQSSNTNTSEKQTIFDDDNLFSPWSDFRSSGTQTENSLVEPNDAKTNTDPFSFHKDSITSNSLKMIEDNTIFSSYGDFGGATSSLEQKLQAAGGSSENKFSSVGGDLFPAFCSSVKQSINHPENQLQCDEVKILDVKSTFENDDSFDVWSDFTSSTNANRNHGSSANAADYNEATKHCDTLDAWDVTVSSSNVEDGKDTTFAMGGTSEFSLFSSNVNSQYVASDNLMQPDLSVRMVSNENGSASIPLALSEGRDMVRTEHGDDKADGYVDTMNPNEITSKNKVAETLISEMHDLSFMLKSGLSIPNSGT